MNNLDKEYINLLKDILENGYQKGDRTGTGTISVFGRTIKHKMSEGFPLLTTKKMFFKGIVTELLWFLRGETNIQSLVKDGNNIWVGDCYKRYKNLANDEQLPILSREEFIEKIKTNDNFAELYGDIGPGYGKQWRSWKSYKTKYIRAISGPGMNINLEIDQIQNAIDLLKNNPDSRRIMVSAWNVSEVNDTVLPPCHYGFQLYTRELSVDERLNYKVNQVGIDKNPGFELGKSEEYYHSFCDNWNIPKRAISLKWEQRSVDTGLGLSFNIASYGLLLMIISKQVNMIPEEVIGSLGDTHIYLNHIEPLKEQLKRKPYELPLVKISKKNIDDISEYTFNDFKLINYKSHPKIYLPLSN